MSGTGEVVLKAEGLARRFGGAAGYEVLKSAALSVGAGQSLAVVGPSGSGKSTLLHILGALDRPDAGRVEILGQDPFALPERALAAFRSRHIGFIFQSHHLLPHATVLENVLLPVLASDAREINGEDPESRARRLLERVGLKARMDARPTQLSGGESQRAAVVRALINGPSVLLADEPTGSLDRASATAVGDLLVELKREERVALVVVTHALDLARRMAAAVELQDGVLIPISPA